MKTINRFSSKETAKMILKHGKAGKGLRHWVLNHLLMILMALFMIAIAAPLSAGPRGEKIRSTTCHHKIITRTVPVFITKKNNPVMKNHSRQTKSRKYCFLG